jgi:hypothetical protein
MVAPVSAQDLIQPQPTRRKFPVTVFCPIPLTLTFVADGPSCLVQFATNDVHYFSTSAGEERWSQQMLDNLCVTPEATYQAHKGPLDLTNPDFPECYSGAPVFETFYFHEAGPIPLLEKFDTDPGVAGWNLSNGAYWIQTRSGTNDPGTNTSPFTGGSLGLGLEAGPDSAWTYVVVSGLTKGQTYRVTGWWNVQDVFIDQDLITLWVSVLGNASTPLARESWGSVRRRWH